MLTYELDRFVNPKENINIILMKKDLSCNIHTHEFVELIFTVDGRSEHWIDGKSYLAEAGDLLFVNYGQTHCFNAWTEEHRYYNLLYIPEFFSDELINSENIYEIFSIPMFNEFMGAKSDTAERGALHGREALTDCYHGGGRPKDSCENCEAGASQMVSFRGEEHSEVLRLVEDMHREFDGKETGYRSILNGYSRVLFSKILRKLKGSSVSGETQKYINRITEECLAYINARCFQKITLKELAEHTFYNPSYFSRIFKEQCGVSLSEYIRERRITEAARLLRTTDLANADIMEKVGYTDKKQFYKNFREIYSVTPAQYRKKME